MGGKKAHSFSSFALRVGFARLLNVCAFRAVAVFVDWNWIIAEQYVNIEKWIAKTSEQEVKSIKQVGNSVKQEAINTKQVGNSVKGGANLVKQVMKK